MALKKVQRPERIVSVCLDGTLVAEAEAIEAQLEETRNKNMLDPRLNSASKPLELRLGQLRQAQVSETVTFLLRGMKRDKWDEAVSANPPRSKHALDESYGFNTDTIFDYVIAEKENSMLVEVRDHENKVVEFDCTEWPDWSSELTKAQYEQFRVAIKDLNGSINEVPFSLSGYKAVQNSASK